MRAPFLEQEGFSRTVSFIPCVTVATLCWMFGNQQSLVFSHLMRIHCCGSSLFHVFILGNILMWVSQRLYSSTLLYCTKFVVLPFTSLSEKGVLCQSGFDYISDSYIFHFTNAMEKLLSCMFSWLKIRDNCLISHANCLFGKTFAWGSMCKVSFLCRACLWSLGRVPDAPPNSKVIVVPFVLLVPEKRSQIFIYI